MSEDAVTRGFLFMKELIAKYGTDTTADLMTLAQRAVDQGLYPNVRAAVNEIEKQLVKEQGK